MNILDLQHKKQAIKSKLATVALNSSRFLFFELTAVLPLKGS